MKEGNIYKAFNARWISPENVARKFVRTPQFSSLIGPDNCVLAGPRGCGKTTLLKMLTSRAQHVWGTEVLKTRKKVEPYTVSFEAIYIPSDIRWSYELRAMVFDLGQDDLAEICQRVLVTSNSIRCALGVFDDILKRNNSSSIETETILSKKVMSMFSLTGTIPSLSECSGLLRAISSNIKGLINLKEIERLKEYIKGLNPSLFSDVLDPIIGVCNIFNEVVEDSVKIAKWGICYDEVEIAPTWFGNELFAALRSLSDQNFLLKFTWSPILPSRTPSGAEIAEDYDPVKLWSSHVVDPKEFCENLTEDFLASKFSDSNYTGSDFLGSSGFASEGAKEEAKSIYQPGSFLHKAMLSLYKKDTSFRDFVDAEGIDIETGFTVKGDNEGVGDKLFRKLKPIVLMRDEFMKGSVKRTRKRVTLYSGKEAVFGMSEGNPRKLLGLLNDLFDLHSHKNDNYKNLGGPVAELTQARVLSSASARTVTALKSTPVYPDNPYRSVSFSLYKIVDLIGNYFHTRFYDSDFDLDPLGSFRVDEGLDPEVIHVLSRLIDAGSIIPVSQSHGEIPSEIIGNRFRLSFMISPTYKLAFRNYGEMSLASILGKQEFGNQLSLFEE